MLDFASLKNFEGKLYQPKSLIKPPHLNLEALVTNLISARTFDFQESDLRGKLGEVVSRELIRYNLSQNSYFDSNKLFDFKGKEYVLGESSRGEIIKFDSYGRVVLIKRVQSSDDDSKFGFKNISEVDGILRLRRNVSRRKKEDHHVVIESKTGKIDVTSTHIRDRILKPYSRILDSPISYILVGFEEYLMNDERVLNSKIHNMYEIIGKESLRRESKLNLHLFSFTAIPFPFTQENFNQIINFGLELQKGVLSVTGQYVVKNNELTIKTSRGDVKRGVFIPEDDPRYSSLIQ